MGFKSLKPEAKTQVNRFSLTVGTSGNTTYILGQTFPAGDYTIEFSNEDTTYDIYAIGTDGTNVGYTNGVTLTANAPINEIVVLGAADNEVITFENFTFDVVGGGDPVAPSSAGDVASAGAFITSVNVSSLPNADDTTTITGGNFAADVQVFFTGQDSVELEAKSLTRNSSTELVATRPDALDADDSPYTVKVVNPGVTEPTGSSAHLLPNSITAGANPSWVTAAAQEYNPDDAVSITLSATDADGTVSYSLQSGTLPGGLSLNGSTGEISGTPTTSDGDVNVFTIRATDEGGNFVDREFTFTAALPALEYLVIAGGGGGGGNIYAGGGGAGGYRSSVTSEASGGGASAESVFTFDLATNYTITVGAGGSDDSSGSNSVFNTVTSIGGGSGGSENNDSGGNGGSGGGGAGNNNLSTNTPQDNGGDGTVNQGFGGGGGIRATAGDAGGGGGGAGEAGFDAGNFLPCGFGGDGIESSITGTATFRAGGGGGKSSDSSGGGAGGGGGADQNGTANTGGGGGGNNSSGSGGSGGSGIVILRYSSAYSITIGAGLTGTENTDGDFKYAEITAGTGNVSWSEA